MTFLIQRSLQYVEPTWHMSYVTQNLYTFIMFYVSLKYAKLCQAGTAGAKFGVSVKIFVHLKGMCDFFDTKVIAIR